ncbi:hypothetical protein [Clostridium hydrogenum]|uniref:hypothetical protein n=1 Tax=Clostridium hydrogenum TaxID=2855764 RepID=UPI001F3D2A79|nr:hypothetical protein [Clostridium hydrogenum]
MSNKGFIYIEYLNGIYIFNNNTDNVLNANDISKEYRVLDLSSCNCLDDIVFCISDADLDVLLFYCNKDNIVLINELCKKIFESEVNIQLIWMIPEVESKYLYPINNKVAIVVRNLYDISNNNNETIQNITFEKLISAFVDVEAGVNETEIKKYMSDSLCLMLTGKYPNSYVFSKSKHIFVHNAEIMDKLELTQYMDINSIIFIPNSEVDSSKYREWKKRYYNHINTISKNYMDIDGKKQKIQFGFSKYSDFFKERSKKITQYLKLEDKDDFDSLLQDTAHFAQTGIIRDHQFYLLNECRWANRCSLLYQMRLFLYEDGTISPCGGKSECGYCIDDDEYTQFTGRQKIIEQTQVARECKNCAASRWCTKCSFPPESIKSKEYCKMIIEHPEIPDFINIKNILLMLEKYTKLDSKMKFNEMIFSNYKYSLLLPGNISAKKPISQNIFLFQYDNKYYYLNPLKGRVLKIGFYLAFVLEAIQKGYGYDETRNFFVDKWSEECCETNFQNAWDKVNNNILNV